MRKEKNFYSEKTKRKMRLYFSLTVGITLLLATLIMVGLEFLLVEIRVFDEETITDSEIFTILLGGVASIILGTAMSYFVGRSLLSPLNRLVDGMVQLSEGKYDVRLEIEEKGQPKQLFDRFNALAKELQNIEILRADFINNFSHEFKTPIVSIKGLVGLMKKRDLPKEKQEEYLSVIEEELSRLSLITTNVLNLSKLENQGVVTGVEPYNLSEQLRTSVLLFERAWREKGLSLSMDFPECTVVANEEMMRQVFVNLLDNAIKFTPTGGALSVEIDEGDEGLMVHVCNEGPEIPPEEREKVFQKFYQVDRGGVGGGNGLGLSIVKEIVSLHGGRFFCDRRGDMTVFTVCLPHK